MKKILKTSYLTDILLRYKSDAFDYQELQHIQSCPLKLTSRERSLLREKKYFENKFTFSKESIEKLITLYSLKQVPITAYNKNIKYYEENIFSNISVSDQSRVSVVYNSKEALFFYEDKEGDFVLLKAIGNKMTLFSYHLPKLKFIFFLTPSLILLYFCTILPLVFIIQGSEMAPAGLFFGTVFTTIPQILLIRQMIYVTTGNKKMLTM